VRVEGTANVQGKTVPWEAVVKILDPPAGAGRTGEGNASAGTTSGAWDREARAYRSGLLRHLPRGLAAPRLLHVERDGGAVWLWLEHVEDAFAGRWPLAQYGIAARHLGRLNGAFAENSTRSAAGARRGSGALRPLAAYRWLSRGWAASHSQPERLPAEREALGALLAHPAVRAVFPEPEAGRLRRLLDDQPFFLDLLARLPGTLCHHDASSANLIARRRTGVAPNAVPAGLPGDVLDDAPGDTQPVDECTTWETVAVDWEEIGYGPVGAEVATLVFGTMRRGAFPAALAGALPPRLRRSGAPAGCGGVLNARPARLKGIEKASGVT
jgi:hypothetical protein